MLIEWYCNLCWQEGEFEDKEKFIKRLPKNVPEIRAQHKKIIAGIIGGGHCDGDLRPKRKPVKKPPKPAEQEPLALSGVIEIV